MDYFRRFGWNFWVNTLGKSKFLPLKLRYYIYKMSGMRTATQNIRAGCTFEGKNIVLEKGVFLNQDVFIDCYDETVLIKENASIAFGVAIFTSTHLVGNKNKRTSESQKKPVTIGKGCWVGARAVILPGVSIGDGCIIAAGAVVNKDCEPDGLYAGVPAKRIKELD